MNIRHAPNLSPILSLLKSILHKSTLHHCNEFETLPGLALLEREIEVIEAQTKEIRKLIKTQRADIIHRTIREATKKREILVNEPAELLKNYKIIVSDVLKDGLYYYGKNKKGIELDPFFVCSPFFISCVKNPGKEDWGPTCMLEWKDPEGHPHALVLPFEQATGQAVRYRRVMLSGGMEINHSKKAYNYLHSYILAHIELMKKAAERLNASELFKKNKK